MQQGHTHLSVEEHELYFQETLSVSAVVNLDTHWPLKAGNSSVGIKLQVNQTLSDFPVT